MTRWMAVLISVASVIGSGRANAQSVAPGQGTVVLTLIPGGATFFTEGKDSGEPSFGNYELGGSVTVNFNRFVGVEGEVSGSLGLEQDLTFAGQQTANIKTPNLLNYSGNVVVSLANHSLLTPYVTGGVGGLSLFERPSLGITGTETFFTSNVGAGVKWFTGRWGLRGDYRFIAVQSKDDAPAFFGQETRYGHRVYGAILVNVGP